MDDQNIQEVPSLDELNLYWSFWEYMDANPSIDEDTLMVNFVRKHGIKTACMDLICYKVDAYAQWVESNIKRISEQGQLLRTAVIEKAHFLGSTRCATLKLNCDKYRRRGSIVKDFQALLTHTFASFNIVSKISIWVTRGGLKIASLDISREGWERNADMESMIVWC